MRVAVTTRSGKTLLSAVQLKNEDAKVSEIATAIAEKYPMYGRQRQRLTFGKQVLEQSQLLSKYGIKDDDTIIFKDLGPQIGWKTVFIIEYLGPILVHSAFFLRPDLFYGRAGLSVSHTLPQTVGYLMVILHFIKRELETMYVHRFSNDTMPLINLPKNSFHYWVLGGLFVAFPLYNPAGPRFSISPNAQPDSATITFLLLAWFLVQLCNFTTHVMLMNLRPQGTRERKVPYGFMFELVSCPNYLFEILGWIIYSVITGSIPAWLFTIVGALQMLQWALKKHQRYRQEFKNYPKHRKALIPFII